MSKSKQCPPTFKPDVNAVRNLLQFVQRLKEWAGDIEHFHPLLSLGKYKKPDPDELLDLHRECHVDSILTWLQYNRRPELASEIKQLFDNLHEAAKSDLDDKKSLLGQIITPWQAPKLSKKLLDVARYATAEIEADLEKARPYVKSDLEKAEREAEGEQAATGKTGRIREPSKIVIAAYRYHILRGEKQAKIAEKLTAEFGSPVSQGQVSRWIREVRQYIEAGNVLPDLDGEKLNQKPTATDPAIIEMGEREDHLTKRQRPRCENEEY